MYLVMWVLMTTEFLTVGNVEGEADSTYGLSGKDGLKMLNCGERSALLTGKNRVVLSFPCRLS